MPRIARGDLIFYQSELLASFPTLTQAVTTRCGGVSPAPFHSLNLSAHVGDAPENVAENWKRVHSALGLDGGSIVDAKQAQANHVAQVQYGQRGTRLSNVDGLFTDSPGVPLVLRFADCVPVLFYDRTHHAAGIAHAGWRGTVGRVVTNTARAMCESFNAEPKNLYAYVGPSIGPCCYEIGPDVAQQVTRAFPNWQELLIHRNGAIFFDLWEANARQLRALGVAEVEMAGVCTADHTDDLYSWRREHAKTGRFAAIIALDD